MNRRDFFRTAGIGSASLVALPALAHALTIPESAGSAPAPGEPANPFVVLLRGTYQPVVRCPALGLSADFHCDGTYSTTKIYSVSGPDGVTELANQGNHLGDRDRAPEKAIGNFYVSIGSGKPVAYDLPGGAMAMVFTGQNVQRIPDGSGGTFIVGTFDLDITEATGIYESFVGGHNKMVDILHRVDADTFVEHCYCIISRP